ncbi:hypothetical protein GCM10010978_28330 [Compostibacillus humi]|uniref:Uncharacterized protein n=1 Tax=Compostibacillus humi TaxID=1245525 RepID=A0A8J2TUM1_9BACI|nr:hypothetical protein [Compostibacillus humi]GFZ86770.1 hypothetical protein GCM10010978_28330 [Compostibacillus humi]
MHTFSKLLEKTYSFITLLSMFVGFIVAMMFLIGIVAGGSFGESLSVFAGNLMTWAIRLAALAILAGIFSIYLKKNHTLTITNESNATEKSDDEKRTVV